METIQLLQLEIEEKNEQIQALENEKSETQQQNEHLRRENDELKNEHINWQERLRSLLGKIDNV